MIYGFPDLVLEAFCGVTCGGLEIVVVDEVLYFCLVLLGLNYNEGIPFVGRGDHGVIFFEFRLD